VCVCVCVHVYLGAFIEFGTFNVLIRMDSESVRTTVEREDHSISHSFFLYLPIKEVVQALTALKLYLKIV